MIILLTYLYILVLNVIDMVPVITGLTISFIICGGVVLGVAAACTVGEPAYSQSLTPLLKVNDKNQYELDMKKCKAWMKSAGWIIAFIVSLNVFIPTKEQLHWIVGAVIAQEVVDIAQSIGELEATQELGDNAMKTLNSSMEMIQRLMDSVAEKELEPTK